MKTLLQLTLLLAGLAWCVPAQATWTLSQHKNKTACGAATCTITGFTAVAAGSFIFATPMVDDSSTAQVTATTGASGGGTYVLPTVCGGTGTAACRIGTTGRSIAVQYVASSTGSPTSLSCTSSLTMNECYIAVLTFTSGPVTEDVGSTRSVASAANLAGTSVGTITGTNDAIFQFGIFTGSSSACPNSGTGDFPNGNGGCVGPINSTSNTAGTWTNTSVAGTVWMGAIAFKEAAAATAHTMPPAVY